MVYSLVILWRSPADLWPGWQDKSMHHVYVQVDISSFFLEILMNGCVLPAGNSALAERARYGLFLCFTNQGLIQCYFYWNVEWWKCCQHRSIAPEIVIVVWSTRNKLTILVCLWQSCSHIEVASYFCVMGTM